MKRKTVLALCPLVLAAGLAGWLVFCTEPLPRMTLADGGEFRVVKVVYGTDEDHYLHGAPKVLFRLWGALPGWMQRVVPYPWVGTTSETLTTPGISVWYGWFHPVTGERLIGPAGDGIMTLDSGGQIFLGWPNPADDYRQILIARPPRDSQWLHFSVPINDLERPAKFSIRNPAYGR